MEEYYNSIARADEMNTAWTGKGTVDVITHSLNLIGYGTKKTGIDGGSLGQLYFDDDYLYVCVKSGEAPTAVWKKIAISNT